MLKVRDPREETKVYRHALLSGFWQDPFPSSMHTQEHTAPATYTYVIMSLKEKCDPVSGGQPPPGTKLSLGNLLPLNLRH